MTDISIKASNVSAKSESSKPASSGDTTQQDTQGFGSVLARQIADQSQVADKSQTADKSSSADSAARTVADSVKLASESDSSELIVAADSGSALPADIMAALLAQQNSGNAPQPEVLPQPNLPAQQSTQILANVQAQADTAVQAAIDPQSATNLIAVPGKATKAELNLLGEKSGLMLGKTTAAEIALPQPGKTMAGSKGLADTFQSAMMKEMAAGPANQTARGGSIPGDLSSAMPLPAMMAQAESTPANTSPMNISTPLNQPAWGDEFSQKITWMGTQRNQSAELHLNPPQLGPLDVVLKMNGDQANATFTSPHAAVREAIEQAIPKLREMLADSGIMLGNAMVNDHSAKNNQENSPRNAQGRTDASGVTTEAAVIPELRVSPLRRHNGMVDTFA